MYFLLLVEKIETNIHLEQPFYLLTKTWKYGGSVLVQTLPEELKQSKTRTGEELYKLYGKCSKITNTKK